MISPPFVHVHEHGKREEREGWKRIGKRNGVSTKNIYLAREVSGFPKISRGGGRRHREGVSLSQLAASYPHPLEMV